MPVHNPKVWSYASCIRLHLCIETISFVITLLVGRYMQTYVFTCRLVSWLWSRFWSILIMFCTFKSLSFLQKPGYTTWSTLIETRILWHVNTLSRSLNHLTVTERNQDTCRQTGTWILLISCIQGYEYSCSIYLEYNRKLDKAQNPDSNARVKTQFCLLSLPAGIFDPYIPPEGDARLSSLSKEGLKQRTEQIRQSAASQLA